MKIKWDNDDANRLIRAFMTVRASNEVRDLLDDLLTENELRQCIQRLKAIRLLLIAMPYEFISMETGLGSKTIARLSKLLINKDGGFHQTMKRLHPRGIRLIANSRSLNRPH